MTGGGKKKKGFVKVKGKGPGLTRFGSQAESGVCQLFEEQTESWYKYRTRKNLHKAVLISMLVSVAFLNQNSKCNGFDSL